MGMTTNSSPRFTAPVLASTMHFSIEAILTPAHNYYFGEVEDLQLANLNCC